MKAIGREIVEKVHFWKDLNARPHSLDFILQRVGNHSLNVFEQGKTIKNLLKKKNLLYM